MTKIYEQHDAAFSRVSAYVVARNGERVATIAFKFPADGAGRLWAYVHWLGLEMVRGIRGRIRIRQAHGGLFQCNGSAQSESQCAR